MNVNNHTVVLTGATGGIGSALAQALANRGARLILVGRNKITLDNLKNQLPGTHCGVIADLCTTEGCDILLNELDNHAPVDLLINNAGVSELALYESQPDNRIRRIIELNLLVPMLLTRAMLPKMNGHRAQILNIGSTFGSIGYPGFSAYCASKFGLRGFSEAMNRELSDRQIIVQYAAPRATRTMLNTTAVNRLNERLGNRTDDPAQVADSLCNFIASGNRTLYLGWPEKFLVRLNAVFSTVVDKAIKPKLSIVKQTIQEH